MIFEFDDPNLADELKLNADDHLEGDPTAPAVLIEYLSLQCPSCAAAHPQVEQLLTDNQVTRALDILLSYEIFKDVQK